MNSKLFILPLSAVLVLNSCKSNQSDHATITKTNQDTMMSDTTKTFEHISEQFADLRILLFIGSGLMRTRYAMGSKLQIQLNHS
jgi:hypothetical protein